MTTNPITDEQIDASGLDLLDLPALYDDDLSNLRVASLADLLIWATEHRVNQRALTSLVVLEMLLEERGIAWICDCGEAHQDDAARCACGATLGQLVMTEVELFG